MSVPITDIIAAAEQDSDKVGDASVTAAWPIWYPQAIESLWKLLITNYRDLYYDFYDFSLVSTPTGSILTLSTPPVTRTFRILVGLDLDPATSNRRRVKSRPFVNRNDGAWGSLWRNIPWATDREYMLQGNKLMIAPYEQAAGNYRMHYRYSPGIPANDPSGLIDNEMDPYAEYLSSFMARKALAKEESDTAPVDARLNEIRNEIIEASTRNEADPFVIADVEDCGP